MKRHNDDSGASMSIARNFPAVPALSSLAGLLFCLWVLLSGGKELCLTDGCALFQDFSLAGISLWAAGTAFFAALLLLCVLRATRIAKFFCAAALIADAVLMAIMAFTAPCVNCLVAGLLIALSFVLLRRTTRTHGNSGRSPLLLIWGLLFIVSAGGVARDLTSLWTPLPHNPQASMQVFFSPSCRACQTLTAQAGNIPDANWFPVAEDTRDIWIIRAMTRRIEQGQSLQDAVLNAAADVPGLADAPDIMAVPGYRFGLLRPDILLLQFRLWKNLAHVLAAGSDRLPFVEFRGLPAFFREDAPARPGYPGSPSAPAHASTSAAHDERALPLFSDFGIAGFCHGDKEKSCDEASKTDKKRSSSDGLIDTSGMAQ